MGRQDNFYFELTEAFNAAGRIAVLASGQAVVYYRLAMMSKDGDWILRETAEACAHVRQVLAERGARYRPGALALPDGHRRICELAERFLPEELPGDETP